MKVSELIAELQKLPQELGVQVWDASVDDFVDVAEALHEDSVPYVHLNTFKSDAHDDKA